MRPFTLDWADPPTEAEHLADEHPVPSTSRRLRSSGDFLVDLYSGKPPSQQED